MSFPPPETIGLAIVTKDRFYPTVETVCQLDLNQFDEVVIVDDSVDDKLEQWCSSQSVIRYIDGPGVNMQAARNLAIDTLNTDIISFFDDDVYCHRDLGTRVLRTFIENEKAVAVGGPCPSVTSKPTYGVCRYSAVTISRFGTIYGDVSRIDSPDSIGVDTLKGANMSFRRNVIDDIGGFDVAYRSHSQREETDVFVRIAKHGEIILDPRLTCYHLELGDEFSVELFNWRFRNHARFVRKNFGRGAAIIAFFGLFFRLCGSPESIYQLLFEKYVLKRPLSIIGSLKGYWQGYADSDT